MSDSLGNCGTGWSPGIQRPPADDATKRHAYSGRIAEPKKGEHRPDSPFKKIPPPLRVSARGPARQVPSAYWAAPPGSLTRSGGAAAGYLARGPAANTRRSHIVLKVF